MLCTVLCACNVVLVRLDVLCDSCCALCSYDVVMVRLDVLCALCCALCVMW